MGQQQLLLVILVTIIVGIATVVAINTFGSAADSANVDAVRNDLTSMAAAAQSYVIKPNAMGGGGGVFTGIGFNDMGSVACDQTTSGSATTGCENENGTYTISADGGTTNVSITGVPKQAAGNIIITVCKNYAAMSDYSPDASASTPSCP